MPMTSKDIIMVRVMKKVLTTIGFGCRHTSNLELLMAYPELLRLDIPSRYTFSVEYIERLNGLYVNTYTKPKLIERQRMDGTISASLEFMSSVPTDINRSAFSGEVYDRIIGLQVGAMENLISILRKHDDALGSRNR